MRVWIATVMVTATVVVLGMGATAGATPSCNAADYTTGGVFDLQGYLACMAGPTLPSTGSNTLQIIGISVGLLVIGAGSLFTSRRNRLRTTL